MLQRIDPRAPATLHRGCLGNGTNLQLRTGTPSSTWARRYMPAPWLRKRMRYRSPRNWRKTTLGTAVGFRCTIRAAMNSRGCRSASKERSRSRKPLGGTRSKRSENRKPCRGGGLPDTSTAWLRRLDGENPKDSASAQLCTAVVSGQ
jgi:hypothetical protein